MAQFEHATGRGHGGGNRDDRTTDEKGKWMNAAVCGDCNMDKASRRYMWVNGSYVEVNKYREVA